MLLACGLCHRQHDVRHLEVGDRVACDCGVLLDVEEIRPRPPVPLRCSACGGPLREGSGTCAWCSCESSRLESGLSEVCPSCFARMAPDARYCMDCGVRIQAQVITTVRDSVACPRCEGRLRSRVMDRVRMIECSACHGLWLSPECFRRFCTEAAESAALDVSGRARPRQFQVLPESGYLPCVVCNEWMARQNYARVSGVVIDVCAGHGVWLDHPELQRILEFIRSGGLALDRARRPANPPAAETTKKLEAPDTTPPTPTWRRPRSRTELLWNGVPISELLERLFQQVLDWASPADPPWRGQRPGGMGPEGGSGDAPGRR